MHTFILINFLWNLLPEVVQDKIKEVSVDKAHNFLEAAFSDETTISTAFWKALEKIVAEVYIDSSREVIKHRFQQALQYPDVKKRVIIFCKEVPITEVSHSLENETYWKRILEETFRLVQMTNWKLEEEDKTFFFPILIAQYTIFKQYFIQNLSENTEESIKVLLATTLKTHVNMKQILAAINKLAQAMIGQIQQVNIEGNNNLILIDVKGKEIAISSNTFLKQYDKLFEQILYLIKDKHEVPYVTLKTEIEQKIIAKRSELDEYNLYIESQDLNYNAESSRAIYGKTVVDLDKKALNALFKTELTKQHLLNHGSNRKTSIETKLKTLSLMSNGYVVKGTFLCLCPTASMRTINTTADYISFGVYTSKDRTKIKIANEFYGNLVYQFEQVEDALISNLGSLQIIDLMERELDYEIPKFVFRELIANAVVHRDYSEKAKIHTTIELYQDRLVVRNPGNFPDHIDPNDLDNIQSKSINKEIARIFFLHGIVQKKGSGIQRVQSTLSERGMRPAVFEEREGIVSVTVYKKESKIYLLEKAQEYHALGDYAQEFEYRKKALAIDEKTLAPTDIDLATSYNNIATTYQALGDLPQSLEYGIKALDIYEKVLLPEHPDLATSYNNIGETYRAMGNLPQSLEYGLKALTIWGKIFPAEHPILATSYNNIGETYRAMGDLPQSLNYGLKALAIYEKAFSVEHPSLATSYNNIASTYKAMGDLPKSLEYGLKALTIKEKALSAEHPSLATSYNNIGNIYYEMGDLPKSLKYGLKSLAIFEKNLSAEHPSLATSYNNIASTYQAMGDLPKSLEYGLKALTIREKVLSAEHPDVAQSYNNIAVVYQYLFDWEKALFFEQKALKILLKVLPSGHYNTKSAVNTMAGMLNKAITEKGEEWAMPYKIWFEEHCKAYLVK